MFPPIPLSSRLLRRSVLAFSILEAWSLAPQALAADNAGVAAVTISGNKAAVADNSYGGGYLDTPALEVPFSINAWSAQKMQDWQVRQSTDLMKYDASVNEAYNAIGYAEQFSIRGFALNNESSYRKDGFAIPGDASIPLENKERVEILKGLSGFQSGLATPGGILNYVTKRPTTSDLRTINTEISERGTLYGAADLGGMFGNGQFGYRFNVAEERLRSYVKGANGERQFFSAAFDWHLSRQALLQLDVDYQHKSQLSVPGFQLTNGTNLPQGIRADTMLNNQAWAKPVDTRDSNLGARFEYRFNDDWSASAAANTHQFKRNDYTAFPYGCNGAAGYCANGDYDVYDYRSLNESKTLSAMQALLKGRFVLSGQQHEFASGISSSERRDYFADYVYDFVGTSNIYQTVALPASPNQQGAATWRRTDRERAVFAQDIVSLAPDWKLHLGLRHVQIERRELDNPGYNNNYLLSNGAVVYQPVQKLALYASFAQGLEHGGIAPFGTVNANNMLNPSKSKQWEIGVKREVSRDVSVNLALFEIKKTLEYINGSNVYVQNGTARHRGMELTTQVKLAPQWQLGASAAWLKATQRDTGEAMLDGKRVLNVPQWKSTVYVDYAVANGVNLNASWQYSGNKAYNPDNSVIVPGYQVFNLGARYVTMIGHTRTTLRLNIDNVFDKFYWRDATQSLGGYLFPGAPRIAKLSAQFEF
ncbi:MULTISPECIES: TonB-dependent siderophore receptor [unclassified Undibacterium]|uniref:TonB-dependent siderophore receptor n=2 Tax=Pseudomonadota TaxID=1224 RepID=UPI002AC9F132|nr:MULTISPECIES: TonB-dependent siderophore receptor [unclassified Undibacterium]MEB0140036.1 TonB-dependent siderophore receptor [Undibacterium sp. CCC2.1]MEB0173051.1 TonB-dependent siderophore receptor [Undibacterium sp. CCC1.1]MEB0176863.1 TonB-dependent siderophore receptor [Undibacterium sp. CCC3.4]MEB0216095.1 TonB-dependent siderophore receptor [Undibacterium sp. 5I2]WPX42022.1 TonB-dependent siderophore receptor [Undibacterium sp. CCC3.4]